MRASTHVAATQAAMEHGQERSRIPNRSWRDCSTTTATAPKSCPPALFPDPAPMRRQLRDTTSSTARSQHQGPPLHICIDWVKCLRKRAALLILFAGDWAIGRYAGNYFAKTLLPCRPSQIARAQSLGVEPNRVCTYCWHNCRIMVEESEAHALMECPLHGIAREESMMAISEQTFQGISVATSSQDRLLTLFIQSSTRLSNFA